MYHDICTSFGHTEVPMTGTILNAMQGHHLYTEESVLIHLTFDYQVIFQQIGTLTWKHSTSAYDQSLKNL